MLVVNLDVEATLGARVHPCLVDLVLLGLKAKRVPPGLFDLVQLAVVDEPAKGVPVPDELLVVELAVEEVLPPLRPLLALVVVEQVREQPVGVALFSAGEERVADAAADIARVALLGAKRGEQGPHPLAPLPGRPRKLHGANSSRRDRLTIIAAVAPQIRRPSHSIS